MDAGFPSDEEAAMGIAMPFMQFAISLRKHRRAIADVISAGHGVINLPVVKAPTREAPHAFRLVRY